MKELKLIKLSLVFISILIFATSCGGPKSISGYKNISCIFADTVTSEDKMILDISKYKLHKTVDNGEYTDYLTTYLSNGYLRSVKYKDSDIRKSMIYDSLDRIEALFFRIYSFDVGREYYFDKLGNITEIKDSNEGYSICWQQALYIAKLYAGEHFDGKLFRAKTEPKRRRVWEYIYTSRTGKGRILVTFDGNTGRFIKESRVISVY